MAYGAVDRKTWNDELFRTWSNDTKLIWLYLLTCPHGNRIGCFVLDPGYAAADLQMTKHEIESALEFFEQEDRIAWDPAARVVCIRKHLHPDYNPLANQSVAKAAAKDVRELPRSMKCFQALLEAVEKWGRPHYKPFTEALMHRVDHGDRHGGGHQDQEQDHEQEQSTKGSSLRSSPSEDEPRVEKPQVEETEPWNARLAPVIREAAYHGEGPPEGHQLSRCLSKAKQLMSSGYEVDDLEDAIRGLRRMAETKHEDVRSWLEPGDRFTVLAFGRAEEKGQKLVQVAAHEWRKRGPPPEKRRRSSPVRVSEVAGGV